MRGGYALLYPPALKAAREAAEAAGEELPVFVTRVVETQAQRDSITRKKPRTKSLRLDRGASTAYNKHRKGAAGRRSVL